MRIYNAEDIEKIISMEGVIRIIENFYLQDTEVDIVIPERMIIGDGDNTSLLMPAYYDNYYGVKLVGVAPGNAAIGEATLHGTYVLSDRKTLKPLAVMDARTITALRTGAIGGLGMKYMAKDDAKIVGVIGTGDQGWSHLQAACAVRPIEAALIYNRSDDRLQQYIEKAKVHFPHIEFKKTDPKEILEQADIVITTTTSHEPVIPEITQIDLSGKHFAASGAFKPFMQEIPNYILGQADHLYVDTHMAFEESGELIQAKELGFTEDRVLDMEQMIKNGEQDKIKEGKTVFKSVGMGIFDVIAAKLIYEI